MADCDLLYDDEALLAGEITAEEHQDRAQARGAGGLVGAVVAGTLVVTRSPVATAKLAKRAWFAATVSRAYKVASQGGKHGGLLKQLQQRTNEQIRKGIRNLEKRIREHQEKIRNPKEYMKRDDPSDSRAVDRARKDWREEIENMREEQRVAEDELRRRWLVE